MPTYEYRCSGCNYEFERFQSITAQPIKRCPQCGKAKVKRLLGTGAGLIFKGSGFYITDYRDSSYKEKAKAESGTAAGEAKSGDAAGAAKAESGGAEAKPAAKAEPAKGGSPKSDTPKKSSGKGKGGSK